MRSKKKTAAVTPAQAEANKFSMNRLKVVSLMGNHEDMWLRASVKMGDPVLCDENINVWMENGGQATLKSFAGIDTKPYLAFLRDLPLFLELDDFFLVHAELDFSLPDPFGKAGIDSMLWGRGKPYHGKKPVLCGHTPLPIEQIQAGLQTNKIVMLIRRVQSCTVSDSTIFWPTVLMMVSFIFSKT